MKGSSYEPSRGAARSVVKALAAIVVALSLSTLVAFLPITGNEFINSDDNLYITENTLVRGGLSMEAIRKSLTSVIACNWHPLTVLSHMLDVNLFGLNPGLHHLTSLLLHTVNAALLFLILRSMTAALWPSAFTAALFALHPLHVESVAWAAERKDVLSTFFWFLSLGAYIGWARKPVALRYSILLGCLALGLAAKPMLVTLPFVLLLFDYWPFGRFGGRQVRPNPRLFLKLAAEKIPLFTMAAISGVITYVVQQRCDAVSTLVESPPARRVAVAAVAYASYVVKMFWPVSLAAYYPYPAGGFPAWQVWGALLFVSGIAVAALLCARRAAYATVGLLWYFGTLVPVIGLVPVGSQIMADRYTYVPLVGLFVVVSWGACDLAARFGFSNRGAAVAAIALLATLGFLTFNRTRDWKDSLTLFSKAVEATGPNWFSINNIGAAHYEAGRNEAAAGYFLEVTRLDPGNPLGYNNLGHAYRRLGRPIEAEREFRKALALKDDHVVARYQLGVVLHELGRFGEAAAAFERVVALSPGDVKALMNLAVTLQEMQRYAEALPAYRKVVVLTPGNVNALQNMGSVLLALDRPEEALAAFRRALVVKGDSPPAHYGVGFACLRLGDGAGARAELDILRRLDPKLAEGLRLAINGQWSTAATP